MLLPTVCGGCVFEASNGRVCWLLPVGVLSVFAESLLSPFPV